MVTSNILTYPVAIATGNNEIDWGRDSQLFHQITDEQNSSLQEPDYQNLLSSVVFGNFGGKFWDPFRYSVFREQNFAKILMVFFWYWAGARANKWRHAENYFTADAIG